MRKYISSLLITLCGAYSASTEEREMLESIKKDLENCADDVYFDGMGNLVAVKKAKRENAKKIMLAANADTPGFIACFIEKNGSVKLHKIGEPKINALAFSEGRFSFGAGAIFKPDASGEMLFADTGYRSENETSSFVKLGMTVSPTKSFKHIGVKDLCYGYGAALRIAAVCSAFRNADATEDDIYALFAVQGCLNHRGLEAALAGIAPDKAIIVGTDDGVGKLSAVVKEKSGMYSGELTAKTGLPGAVLDGGFECGFMLRAGCECAKIVIPTENSGTHAESGRIEDAEAAAEALVKVIGIN